MENQISSISTLPGTKWDSIISSITSKLDLKKRRLKINRFVYIFFLGIPFSTIRCYSPNSPRK
jgi:hypothetical protein